MFKSSKRPNPLDTALLLEHLALLLENGLPLPEALEALREEQTERSSGRSLLNQALDGMGQGRSLAAGLAGEKSLFHAVDLALLEHGEKDGDLPRVLRWLADEKERMHEVGSRVRALINYPVSIMVVMFIVITLLMIKVMPVWSELFGSFGMTLPAPTRMLITVSEFFQQTWWLMAIVLFGGIGLLKRKPRWQVWLMERTPGVRTLREHLFLMEFSTLLTALLESGLPGTTAARQALQCAHPAADDTLSGALSDAITPLLRHTRLFPESFVRQVAMGEKTNSLRPVLNRVARYHEERLMQATHGMVDLMQGMFMLIIACMVGLLLVGAYLPIFQMGGVIS